RELDRQFELGEGLVIVLKPFRVGQTQEVVQARVRRGQFQRSAYLRRDLVVVSLVQVDEGEVGVILGIVGRKADGALVGVNRLVEHLLVMVCLAELCERLGLTLSRLLVLIFSFVVLLVRQVNVAHLDVIIARGVYGFGSFVTVQGGLVVARRAVLVAVLSLSIRQLLGGIAYVLQEDRLVGRELRSLLKLGARLVVL